MKIPYVIDNQTYRLADVLNGLLLEHRGRSLDIATAYFTIGGFGLLRSGLEALGSFRLLLGVELASGEQIGLRPQPAVVRGLLRRDLDDLPFTEQTLRLVEDLIAFLRRDSVAVRLFEQGFLHAKCYLFYEDTTPWNRLLPLAGIVGSSNFTTPGLTSNRELNLSHRTLIPDEELDADLLPGTWPLAPKLQESFADREQKKTWKSTVGYRAIQELDEWFARQWSISRDFKDDLIELLDASKFGRTEYTPYQVYMKALYEYFKDDLSAEPSQATRSAVELAQFQEDAVRKARRILAQYDGVMIADSVGLGKTWIGKKLLEDYAYHQRQKALVICPASLREMWTRELRGAAIAAEVRTQEELGREEFDPHALGDADVVLVDESHNFRNRTTQRYANLERLIGATGGRGRDGGRKKIILLTATPINNDLFDLANQIALITQGDRGYFAAAGIGDLQRYFLHARRESRSGQAVYALFNLLEEIVIRRTRPFIREAYPDATINGKRIHFPKRQLRTIQYDLEATYAGIYDRVVSGIENLRLAPYNLEDYKRAGVRRDEFEAGREEALVGIFKSRYLKRFESSIDAFRISVWRALAFLKTFESYMLDGRILKTSDFQKAMRYLQREDEEDDVTPRSFADDFDATEDARAILASMETVDPNTFDLRRLHDAVQRDVEALTDIWRLVKDIDASQDAKLNRLKELLETELRGQKVLIFTYYKDTARYLYRHLGQPDMPDAERFREQLGGVVVRRMDSGTDTRDRQRTVQAFAPRANGKPELAGSEQEIDILISTDVLSEGQNLQDCGHLINYDLHWNPTRMVQRAGRIDRIGTQFDTLWINNMFPDEGLERLLHLVESLSRKIADIDRAGFLDASVLGETVHPRNFNTLRRIQEEDGSVIEEEEQVIELASSEFLQQQLRQLLDAGGQKMLDALPDGIHSGLVKPNARGVFFYFKARSGDAANHFWKYIDLYDTRIVDNRYLIANLIACGRDTPRFVDAGVYERIFDLQERAIADILRAHQEQQALEVAPRTIDPVQQLVATTLQGYLNHPAVNRAQTIEAIQFLNRPMLAVQIRELRAAFTAFRASQDPVTLLSSVRTLMTEVGVTPSSETRPVALAHPALRRDDLRLVCFDVISG